MKTYKIRSRILHHVRLYGFPLIQYETVWLIDGIANLKSSETLRQSVQQPSAIVLPGLRYTIVKPLSFNEVHSQLCTTPYSFIFPFFLKSTDQRLQRSRAVCAQEPQRHLAVRWQHRRPGRRIRPQPLIGSAALRPTNRWSHLPFKKKNI